MSKSIRKDVITDRDIPQTNKLTEHHYVNMFVRNSEDKEIVASYSSTQNLPVLGHQEDFEVLITRLKVPMSAMPMFLFEEGQYRVGLGIYQIQPDTWTAVPISTNISQIEYVVQQRPSFAKNVGFNNTFEKGIYSYIDFLRQVNAELLGAFIDSLILAGLGVTPYSELFDQIPNLTEENIQDYVPYFKIDECCNKIQFVSTIFENEASACFDLFDSNFEVTLNNPDSRYALRVVMNPKLFSFFNGFSAFTANKNQIVDVPLVGFNTPQANIFFNHSIDYDVGVKKSICIGEGEVSDKIHIQSQDQPSLFSWQKASRILITSTMSVIKEAVMVEGDDGNPTRLEVLTDYAFEQDNSTSNNEYIYYNDTGSGRYHNIKDEGALRRLDFKVFIEYQPTILTGETKTTAKTLPLIIEPGQEVNVKMKFRRKKYNERFQISDSTRHTL
jgi:hypothetical protein